MIAITTNSSIRVNAARCGALPLVRKDVFIVRS
jgi:hypothetical protein